MKDSIGTILVDFDGTLATYTEWKGIDHTGEPIPKMVDRVKEWLYNGKNVKIFTARVSPNQKQETIDLATKTIQDWCQKYIGQVLEVTAFKDFDVIEIWDDRAIPVIKNTGKINNGIIER